MDADIKYRCYQFSLRAIAFLRAHKWDAFSMILYKAEQAKFVPVFKMKFWLKYLTDNPHHADINELLK